MVAWGGNWSPQKLRWNRHYCSLQSTHSCVLEPDGLLCLTEHGGETSTNLQSPPPSPAVLFWSLINEKRPHVTDIKESGEGEKPVLLPAASSGMTGSAVSQWWSAEVHPWRTCGAQTSRSQKLGHFSWFQTGIFNSLSFQMGHIRLPCSSFSCLSKIIIDSMELCVFFTLFHFLLTFPSSSSSPSHFHGSSSSAVFNNWRRR